MSIWQRIFGGTEPKPDNGDRMVRIPADVVAAVAEVTDRPGKYILDAVRQRLREDDQRVWVVYTFIDGDDESSGDVSIHGVITDPDEAAAAIAVNSETRNGYSIVETGLITGAFRTIPDHYICGRVTKATGDVRGLSEGSHPWRAMTLLPGEGVPSGVSVSRLWDEYGSGHYKLSVSGYVPEEVRARFDQEVELIRSGNDRRP